MLSNDRRAVGFVSSYPPGGGGVHRGQHWVGGGNSAVGGGGTSGGGGNQQGGRGWGVSTSKNRTSHHKYKYKSPKKFELKGSKST